MQRWSMRDSMRRGRGRRAAAAAARVGAGRAAGAADPRCGRRSGEDAARRLRNRRDELRPAVRLRCGVRQHHRQHLRRDARLRLPRAPGEARAADARGHADRAGQRGDVRLQAEEGHFLHPRPGVQGQAARAHRRGPGVRDQAPARPRGEEPVAVARRRQDRRRRRRAREGAADGEIRLRRAHSRTGGRRSLHAAHPPEAARSALPLRPRRAQHRGRRARGRRGLRARFRRAPGGHRRLRARRVQAERENRAGGQSRVSRDDVRARGTRCRRNRRRSRRRSRAGSCRSWAASKSR